MTMRPLVAVIVTRCSSSKAAVFIEAALSLTAGLLPHFFNHGVQVTLPPVFPIVDTVQRESMLMTVKPHEKAPDTCVFGALESSHQPAEADSLIQLRVIFKTLAPGLRLGAP